MREIKFRAWDGEKMHYDVVPWQWDFVISLSWHRCERSTGNGILECGGKEGDFLVPGIAFKELMQFTGLLDKNGKEIYEGDYLIHHNKADYKYPQGCVVFRDGGFVGAWIGSKHGGDRLYPRLTRHFKVIGNIYKNPELLQ